MDELLKNIEEFFESGEENLKKARFNAAVSDFFKAIVILCDYKIYTDMKIMPKNHSERFSILEKYFNDVYSEVSNLFQTYTKSYNLRMIKEDAIKLRNYAYGLKDSFVSKK